MHLLSSSPSSPLPCSLLPLLLSLLLTTPSTTASPLASPPQSPLTLAPPAPPTTPWRNATALIPPRQSKKNCKGSGMCPQLESFPCQQAAQNFDFNTLYRNRTAFHYRDSDDAWSTQKCTAIFVCDKGAYGEGMSGGQIQLAFSRMWGINQYQLAKGQKHVLETDGTDLGKPCGVCGSSYMVGGCHVTANYCQKCRDSGDGLGVPLNAPGVEPPKAVAPVKVVAPMKGKNTTEGVKPGKGGVDVLGLAGGSGKNATGAVGPKDRLATTATTAEPKPEVTKV